jgi:two-component system cell cycle response regulator
MNEREKAKILVIDDDEGIRKVIAEALKTEGYAVDTAGNGKDAIEKSQTQAYNLALIDIRLPDMDGTQLLTSLKEPVLGMIKIILTGYPTLQTAVDAVNKGAESYLIKPFNMDDLLRTIHETLKKQKLLLQRLQRATTTRHRSPNQLLRCPQCRQTSFWIWSDLDPDRDNDVSCLNCSKTFKIAQLL